MEVIKVIDFTNIPIHMKEILYIKVTNCTTQDKEEIFRIAQVFHLNVVDYDKKNVLIECIKTEAKNNEMIELFQNLFLNRVEIVRGGSVAVESISVNER